MIDSHTPDALIRELLTEYPPTHKLVCWLTFKTRDLVPSEGGFGIRGRQDSDGDPVCTCGLDQALAVLQDRAAETEGDRNVSRSGPQPTREQGDPRGLRNEPVSAPERS